MHEALKNKFMAAMAEARKIRGFMPKTTDLSFPEMMTLKRISEIIEGKSVKEAGVSEVSQRAGGTKAALSQMLSTLEDKGLIRRSISSSDRRAIVLTITEKGEQILSETRCQMDAFLEELIEKFGTENMTQFTDLVLSLIETVRTMKSENKS